MAKFIDSSRRRPGETVAHWLQETVGESASSAHLQTGYFRGASLSWLSPILRPLSESGLPIVVVVGSNDADSTEQDIVELAKCMSLGQPSSQLGIAAFAAGLFHPKVLHFDLKDGRQVAYVGSANLTASALTGTNIEAGVLLDTEEGDDPALLQELAGCISQWFSEPDVAGLKVVNTIADIASLVSDGWLRGSTAGPRPRRRRPQGLPPPPNDLVRLKPLVAAPASSNQVVGGGRTTRPPSIARPTVRSPHEYYPDYIRCAEGATQPTIGIDGLTGNALLHDADGLIVKLNKDSTRHFLGTKGTCNITLPVPTLNTLRFGVYQGKRPRPRVEFAMRLLYVAEDSTIGPAEATTNVMPYGFHPDESGHGDVRLLVPAHVKKMASEIAASGAVLPSVNALACLIWPTEDDPTFTLVFLEPGSSLHNLAREQYEESESKGEIVGQGACWLLDRDAVLGGLEWATP